VYALLLVIVGMCRFAGSRFDHFQAFDQANWEADLRRGAVVGAVLWVTLVGGYAATVLAVTARRTSVPPVTLAAATVLSGQCVRLVDEQHPAQRCLELIGGLDRGAPTYCATRSARATSTTCPLRSTPRQARIAPYIRATVVFPEPGAAEVGSAACRLPPWVRSRSAGCVWARC
jgi:hypothetical protein